MSFNLYCFINELYVTFNLLIVLVYFILYTISKKYNYLISYKQMIGFSLILLFISSLLLVNFNFNSQYLFFNLFKINKGLFPVVLVKIDKTSLSILPQTRLARHNKIA